MRVMELPLVFYSPITWSLGRRVVCGQCWGSKSGCPTEAPYPTYDLKLQLFGPQAFLLIQIIQQRRSILEITDYVIRLREYF